MPRPLTLLAAVSAGLAVTLVALTTLREPVGPEHATVLPKPLDLPNFELVDQNGAAFASDSFEGQWSWVFFGFTHCPDICPLTLQRLVTARKRLAKSLPEAELPAVVFVSVDPARDNVESIKAYVGAFGNGVRGVTGPLDEVETLTQRLGIFHRRGEPRDGHYLVDHSAAIVVINDDGEYHAVFSAPHTVDALVRDTLTMMNGS